MSGDRIKVYWDSCVYLAWLKDEKRAPGEMDGVNAVAAKITSNEYILVASVIVKTEVLESSLSADAVDKFTRFLKRDNVSLQNVDDRIATLASSLRNYYRVQKQTDNKPCLATPDSLHLATALHYEIAEFHTFDEKDRTEARGLLPLSGNVAGHRLTICKPSVPQSILALEIKPRPLQ